MENLDPVPIGKLALAERGARHDFRIDCHGDSRLLEIQHLKQLFHGERRRNFVSFAVD